MKKLTSLLIISALFLTACGLTVIDSETLSSYPELKGPATSWQALSDAAQAEDCETFLGYMRASLQLTEEICPAVFEYFEDAPVVEWEKTEWNASGGKVKIYELDKGSITGMIHNTAEDTWGADTLFWE
jgi:hypothetical protein